MINVAIKDITTSESDCIVNAANTHLMHGSGVAGAIARAAGPQMQIESRRLIKLLKRHEIELETGESLYTSSFKMPSKWTIHTVGPIWNKHEGQEEELLRSAYRSALSTAKALGAKSISFPAISCGIYGYPIEQGALQGLEEVLEFLKQPEIKMEVDFCLFAEDDLEIFTSVLDLLDPTELALR